jgi:hypothetical protein
MDWRPPRILEKNTYPIIKNKTGILRKARSENIPERGMRFPPDNR